MRPHRSYRVITRVCILALIAATSIWLARQFRQRNLNRALIAAIKRSDASAVDTLLAAGADPNSRDTPLKQESVFQKLKYLFHPPPHDLSPTAILTDLAQHSEDYNFPQASHRIVKALLMKGADPNSRDADGNSPLSSLFPEFYDGKNFREPANNSALLEIILNAGARTSTITPGPIGPPLTNATLHDWPEAVRILLDHGANVNETDQFGNTPLMNASSNNYPDIVRTLLARGADANIRNKGGFRPLYAADQMGYTEVVRILKARGAKD